MKYCRPSPRPRPRLSAFFDIFSTRQIDEPNYIGKSVVPWLPSTDQRLGRRTDQDEQKSAVQMCKKPTDPRYRPVRVDNVKTEKECTDILKIIDTGQVIYSTCRQEDPPTEVISGTETVDVILTSTAVINPRRGVLLYYTAVGCPTPVTPQNGYLVHRTDEIAEFSCCGGYTFPDTGSRTKSLKCLGAHWNSSLPLLDCEMTYFTIHNLTT
ncbi:hypothetical protein NQ317_008539 [Molorchus minor]|uniref:Sushi domain-containing protein n=1 Tax=Molorchus minor TaxID=1323400 RepID=A0ABQ9J394_9CUCU|nr:hypothetical protein NQ317_008539 [Molorchus minor]